MLLLGACTHQLLTPAGPDAVRSALWFEDVAIADDAVPHASLILLSNSPLPCEPEDIADDPATATDEAAAAELYWQGQLYAAFTREDSLVVLLGLYTRSAAWDGDYDLTRLAWESPGEAIAANAHAGFGAYLWIAEAEVDELDGIFYVYEPTSYTYNQAVEAPASATVAATGEALSGEFEFRLDHLSGDFEAESCRNEELYNQLLGIALALGIDPSIVEDLAG